jgi:hypothetical protein
MIVVSDFPRFSELKKALLVHALYFELVYKYTWKNHKETSYIAILSKQKSLSSKMGNKKVK